MESNPNRSTLLLVDDDPSILRLLEKVIENSFSAEVSVESLDDPEAALVRIDQGGVDVLLTDLEMPGINGLELLRSAKRRNAHSQVLLLTGHSSQQALLDALELGASDYLLKPVDQQQLLELVGQALSRLRRWKQALAATWQQNKQKAVANS